MVKLVFPTELANAHREEQIRVKTLTGGTTNKRKNEARGKKPPKFLPFLPFPPLFLVRFQLIAIIILKKPQSSLYNSNQWKTTSKQTEQTLSSKS